MINQYRTTSSRTTIQILSYEFGFNALRQFNKISCEFFPTYEVNYSMSWGGIKSFRGLYEQIFNMDFLHNINTVMLKEKSIISQLYLNYFSILNYISQFEITNLLSRKKPFVSSDRIKLSERVYKTTTIVNNQINLLKEIRIPKFLFFTDTFNITIDNITIDSQIIYQYLSSHNLIQLLNSYDQNIKQYLNIFLHVSPSITHTWTNELLVTRVPDVPDITFNELLSMSHTINSTSTDNIDVENFTLTYNIFNKLKPQVTFFSTVNLDIITSNNIQSQFIKQYIRELTYELKYLFNIFIDQVTNPNIDTLSLNKQLKYIHDIVNYYYNTIYIPMEKFVSTLTSPNIDLVKTFNDITHIILGWKLNNSNTPQLSQTDIETTFWQKYVTRLFDDPELNQFLKLIEDILFIYLKSNDQYYKQYSTSIFYYLNLYFNHLILQYTIFKSDQNITDQTLLSNMTITLYNLKNEYQSIFTSYVNKTFNTSLFSDITLRQTILKFNSIVQYDSDTNTIIPKSYIKVTPILLFLPNYDKPQNNLNNIILDEITLTSNITSSGNTSGEIVSFRKISDVPQIFESTTTKYTNTTFNNKSYLIFIDAIPVSDLINIITYMLQQ